MAINSEETSQADLIMEYFKKNSKREIEHPEIVDWAVVEWKKRTGEVIGSTMLRFHPVDARVWIKEALRTRLVKYNLPIDKIFYSS